MKRMTFIFGAVAMLLGGIGCEPERTLSWSWGPPAPMPKSIRGTAVLDDKIVTVGGTFWVEREDKEDLKIWENRVDLLDTKTMAWKELPRYPRPAGYPFATFIGSKLYVVGGRGAQKGNAETFIMDMAAKNPKWAPGPSLPKPRWVTAGTTIGDAIYIVGGAEGDPSKEGGAKHAPNILALDTSNPKPGWKKITDLPANPAVGWQFVTSCGGKIYVFGGFTKVEDKGKRRIKEGIVKVYENNSLPLVPIPHAFSFDPDTGKWKKLRSLPTPKAAAVCLPLDEKNILIVGGVDLILRRSETPDGRERFKVSSEVWVYDTAADTYTALSPLLQQVCDMGLVYINNTIYSICGESNPFKSRTDIVQIGKLR